VIGAVIGRLSPRQRHLLALAILAVLIAAAGFLAWLPIAMIQRQDAARLAVERRIAELSARLPAREQLLAERRRLERTLDVEQALLHGSTPAVAAAQLQGDLSALAAAMGGEVTTVQIVEPEAAPPFVRIGLRLSLTGDTATVRDFLYAVETRDPVLIVPAMTLASSGREAAGTPEDPILSASFEIYGYAPRSILP
jgi:hypothetical protein